MSKPLLKTRRFIIPVEVVGSALKTFKFKIPAEFIRINGFAYTHDNYPGGYTKQSVLPQIGQLSLCFNNKASNPINIPIIDNPDVDVTTRKRTWLELKEDTRPGEYVEGYIQNLTGLDYNVKVYLKGLIEIR